MYWKFSTPITTISFNKAKSCLVIFNRNGEYQKIYCSVTKEELKRQSEKKLKQVSEANEVGLQEDEARTKVSYHHLDDNLKTQASKAIELTATKRLQTSLSSVET